LNKYLFRKESFKVDVCNGFTRQGHFSLTKINTSSDQKKVAFVFLITESFSNLGKGTRHNEGMNVGFKYLPNF